MIKVILLKVIDFYRNYLSIMKIQSCRYYPTCSGYTREAVERYGALKGVFLGFRRILRCHPFCEGGYDPVVRIEDKIDG